ncbi:unnamed protein product [Rotaria sp. Silwood1]|nr:unnamed protein product [Rotaria sp. Silwood1]CAF3725841.1 unnamed protein product [Rotaria sp. Silwood1]CAF5044713.1 unnamed protein product [Rotaria sp. Silwood1]
MLRKSYGLMSQAYNFKHFYSTSQPPSIPIIDITKTYQNLKYRREIAKQIDEICQNIGFFIITGHSIDENIQTDMMNVSKEFFHLPLSIKQEVTSSKEYPYGYQGLNTETLSLAYDKSATYLLPDFKESFSIGPEHDGPIRWSSKPLRMPSIWLNYFKQCENLAKHLYKILALALNLDERWFENKIDKHRSVLRSLYYPSISSLPENQYRASAHTDWGSFTILKQDSTGGLQVQNHLNGKWIDVPFIENSFVINLGDLMLRWTNDRWVSNLHRVVEPLNKSNGLYPARQSIAYFVNINPDEIVTCIPTYCLEDKPPKYPSIKFWDFIMEKHLAQSQKNY